MSMVFVMQTVIISPVTANPEASTLGIKISPQLATVNMYASKHSEGKKVFFIQDAHSNYEAQQKVRDILKEMVPQLKTQTVLVEGATKSLEPRVFDFSDSEIINKQVAEKLAQKGLVNGAELFMLEPEAKDVSFLGLEKAELYTQERVAFMNVIQLKSETTRFISLLESRLDALKARVFNSKLRELDRKFSDYKKKKISLLAWFRALDAMTLKNLIYPLNDPKNIRDYPNLVRLAISNEASTQIRTDLLAKEKKELTTLLATYPEQQQLLSLIGTNQVSRINEESVARLFEVAESLGVDWNQFLHIRKSFISQLLTSDMDGNELFREMEILKESLYFELAETEKEKKVIQLEHELRILKDLLSLESTRETWKKILAELSQISPNDWMRRYQELELSSKGLELELMKKAQTAFENAVRFYDFARDREQVFAERIRQALQKEKSDSVIVLSGGFHTEGLYLELIKDPIQFSVIQPQLKSKTDIQNYYDAVFESRDLSFVTGKMAAVPYAELDPEQPANAWVRAQIATELLNEVNTAEFNEAYLNQNPLFERAGATVVVEEGIIRLEQQEASSLGFDGSRWTQELTIAGLKGQMQKLIQDGFGTEGTSFALVENPNDKTSSLNISAENRQVEVFYTKDRTVRDILEALINYSPASDIPVVFSVKLNQLAEEYFPDLARRSKVPTEAPKPKESVIKSTSTELTLVDFEKVSVDGIAFKLQLNFLVTTPNQVDVRYIPLGGNNVQITVEYGPKADAKTILKALLNNPQVRDREDIYSAFQELSQAQASSLGENLKILSNAEIVSKLSAVINENRVASTRVTPPLELALITSENQTLGRPSTISRSYLNSDKILVEKVTVTAHPQESILVIAKSIESYPLRVRNASSAMPLDVRSAFSSLAQGKSKVIATQELPESVRAKLAEVIDASSISEVSAESSVPVAVSPESKAKPIALDVQNLSTPLSSANETIQALTAVGSQPQLAIGASIHFSPNLLFALAPRPVSPDGTFVQDEAISRVALPEVKVAPGLLVQENSSFNVTATPALVPVMPGKSILPVNPTRFFIGENLNVVGETQISLGQNSVLIIGNNVRLENLRLNVGDNQRLVIGDNAVLSGVLILFPLDNRAREPFTTETTTSPSLPLAVISSNTQAALNLPSVAVEASGQLLIPEGNTNVSFPEVIVGQDTQATVNPSTGEVDTSVPDAELVLQARSLGFPQAGLPLPTVNRVIPNPRFPTTPNFPTADRIAQLGGVVSTPESFLEYLSLFRATIPNKRFTLEEQVALAEVALEDSRFVNPLIADGIIRIGLQDPSVQLQNMETSLGRVQTNLQTEILKAVILKLKNNRVSVTLALSDPSSVFSLNNDAYKQAVEFHLQNNPNATFQFVHLGSAEDIEKIDEQFYRFGERFKVIPATSQNWQIALKGLMGEELLQVVRRLPAGLPIKTLQQLYGNKHISVLLPAPAWKQNVELPSESIVKVSSLAQDTDFFQNADQNYGIVNDVAFLEISLAQLVSLFEGKNLELRQVIPGEVFIYADNFFSLNRDQMLQGLIDDIHEQAIQLQRLAYQA